MPLVQPPVPAHGQIAPSHLVESKVGRADRSDEHRGVNDVDLNPRLGPKQPAGLPSLGFAALAQVHVLPAGEPVLGIPRALAVAEDHKLRHTCPTLAKAGYRPVSPWSEEF